MKAAEIGAQQPQPCGRRKGGKTRYTLEIELIRLDGLDVGG